MFAEEEAQVLALLKAELTPGSAKASPVPFGKQLDRFNVLSRGGRFFFNPFLARLCAEGKEHGVKIRAAAALLLKNNIASTWKRMETPDHAAILGALVAALSDPSSTIRSAASASLAGCLRHVGIAEFRASGVDAFGALTTGIRAPAPACDGAMRAATAIVTDSRDALTVAELSAFLAAASDRAADAAGSPASRAAACGLVAALAAHPAAFAPGSPTVTALRAVVGTLLPNVLLPLIPPGPHGNGVRVHAIRAATALVLSPPLLRAVKAHIPAIGQALVAPEGGGAAGEAWARVQRAAAQFWTVAATLDDVTPVLGAQIAAATRSLLRVAFAHGAADLYQPEPADAPPHPQQLHYRTDRADDDGAAAEEEEPDPDAPIVWDLEDEIGGEDGADACDGTDPGAWTVGAAAVRAISALASAAAPAVCGEVLPSILPLLAPPTGAAAPRATDRAVAAIVAAALARGCGASPRFQAGPAAQVVDALAACVAELGAPDGLAACAARALAAFAPFIAAGSLHARPAGAARGPAGATPADVASAAAVVKALAARIAVARVADSHIAACAALSALLDAARSALAPPEGADSAEPDAGDAAPAAAALGGGASPEGPTPSAGRKLGAADRAYLAEHNVPEVVDRLIQDLCAARPPDPLLFLRAALDAAIALRHSAAPSGATASEHPAAAAVAQQLPTVAAALTAALASQRPGASALPTLRCALATLAAVRAAADAAGSRFESPELAGAVLPRVLDVWAACPSGSASQLPVASCLRALLAAAPSLCAPHASGVARRCFASAAAATLVPVAQSSGEHAVAAIDLLSVLSDVVSEAQYARILEEFGAADVLARLVEWARVEVRPAVLPTPEVCRVLQSVTGFVADTARVGFRFLKAGVPLEELRRWVHMLATLVVLPSPALANNSAWALGELAAHMSAADFAPVAPECVGALCKVLLAPVSQPVAEMAAVSLGRVAVVVPAAVAAKLGTVAGAWAAAISTVEDRPEKGEALCGMAPLIGEQVALFVDTFPAVADILANWATPPERVRAAGATLLASFARHMGAAAFAAAREALPPATGEALTRFYTAP